MGDIGMIKGGLAWLLRQEGGVVGDVVDHRCIDIGPGVYRREEGEETVNTEQTDASLSIIWQYDVPGVT